MSDIDANGRGLPMTWKRGFTLIELLVAIAMLLPGLSRGKFKAKAMPA
jgi:prepilin-type N-terminal cleavage/methylation domain-containing protein